MLQQTGVARVVPRYERFIARWPSPAACAAAPLAEVLREWQGLGYPRRARRLWEAATVVRDRHGGRVPAELGELLALPGVGAYTARAVLAFAHGADVGVVDTNAARVLARTHGRRLSGREVQAAADAAVPPGQGWEWNQAMLDLGATVCRPTPACPACPVAAACGWRRSGCAEPDPATLSAGVSRPQARFEGSDRQARGRLMKALTEGSVPRDEAAAVMGVADEPARARRLLDQLVDEGLVEPDDGGRYTLAGG